MNSPHTAIASAGHSFANTEFAHEQNTLSNLPLEVLPNGSIMCPIRNSPELRLRSKGHCDEEVASIVTIEIDAQRQSSVGAGVAAESAPRQMNSDVDFVSETDFADGARSRAKPTIEGEESESDKTAIQGGLDIVRKARCAIKSDDEARIHRQDTKPGESTVALYAKKCELIDRMMAEGDEPQQIKLLRALAAYAPTASFWLMRSAFRQRALGKVRNLLKMQDELQRNKKDLTWLACVDQLSEALVELEYVNEATRDICLEYSFRKRKPRTSKSEDLKFLKPNWRDLFLEESAYSLQYRLAVSLHRYCGLRPFEMAAGVELQLQGSKVKVIISGAKCRQTAGQPFRSMQLDLNCLPHWFSADFPAHGRLVVKANEGCMRAQLARTADKVSKRIWVSTQARNKNIVISAYSFRHAFVNDLRAANWSEEEIAGSLGERAAATTKHYGSRPKQTGNFAPKTAILRGTVQVTTPVRPRDPGKLDRVLLNKKASSRPKI